MDSVAFGFKPLRLLVFLATLILCCGPALAASDAFAIRGVAVDSTASTPQAAKDQAIADGQRQAFRLLLERLTQVADHPRLPKVDGLDYVRDFTVEKERSSATRYLASMTVRFNPVAVKKLLAGAQIPFAEPRTRSVLIIPVFTPAEGPATLWDEPNPWRAAWNSLGSGGLVPLIVPAGDLTDSQTLSLEQAQKADPVALASMAARWRNPDVIVAKASLTQGGKALEVGLMASPGAPKPFDTMSYQVMEGENADAMLVRAASDISRAMDTVFKQPNLLQFDRAGTMSALAPLTGLPDWLNLRERLTHVPQVRRWELVSLSRAEAALTLHIVGDKDQVRAALANAGLTMDWNDGYWVMKLGPKAGQP